MADFKAFFPQRLQISRIFSGEKISEASMAHGQAMLNEPGILEINKFVKFLSQNEHNYRLY